MRIGKLKIFFPKYEKGTQFRFHFLSTEFEDTDFFFDFYSLLYITLGVLYLILVLPLSHPYTTLARAQGQDTDLLTQ